MKSYTGIKTVKARPMAMGEAYELNLLQSGNRPSECETDKAGYFVEYEDGYTSWSPADVFEKAYYPTETPQERMCLEEADNEKRRRALANFIKTDKFKELSAVSQVLLKTQEKVMEQFGKLLIDRLGVMVGARELSEALYDFGTAIKFLKSGGAISRASWRGENKPFIVKQVPASIGEGVIPKMQSLPDVAKNILTSRSEPHIDYRNQILIVWEDGRADSWHPTPEDVFADDWELIASDRQISESERSQMNVTNSCAHKWKIPTWLAKQIPTWLVEQKNNDDNAQNK